MDERERHATGMRARREMLGDAHVDRAEALKTDLDAELRSWSRYAWGEVWTRRGFRGIPAAC